MHEFNHSYIKLNICYFMHFGLKGLIASENQPRLLNQLSNSTHLIEQFQMYKVYITPEQWVLWLQPISSSFSQTRYFIGLITFSFMDDEREH